MRNKNYRKMERGDLRLVALAALACGLVAAPPSSPAPGLRGGRCDADGLLALALDPFAPADFLSGAPQGVFAGAAGAEARFAPFEAGVLHIPRASASHFAVVNLTSADLLSALSLSVSLEAGAEGQAMQHGPGKDFQVVKRVRGKDGEWWSGAAPAPAMGAQEAVRWLRRGFTLIVNSVDARFPALARLAAGLEDELGFVVQMNAYLTPKNSQGFEVHWDPMDSFILQLEGSKAWSIYDPLIELPMPQQRFKPRAADVNVSSRQSVTLRPGTTLYLPRGWLHEATTNASSAFSLQRVGSSGLVALAHGQGSSSLHLTVGIEAQQVTWERVLHDIVGVLEAGKTARTAAFLHLALRHVALSHHVLRASLLGHNRTCASVMAVFAAPGAAGPADASSSALSLAAARRALQSPRLAPTAPVWTAWQPLDENYQWEEGGEEEAGGLKTVAATDPRTVAQVRSELETAMEDGEAGDGHLQLANAAALFLRRGPALCEEAVARLWR